MTTKMDIISVPISFYYEVIPALFEHILEILFLTDIYIKMLKYISVEKYICHIFSWT